MEKDKATPPRQKLAELLYDLFQGAPVPARINGEGGKTAFWSRDAQIAYAAQIIAEECTAQKLELRKALRDALDLIWKHHEIGFIRRAYEQGTGSCELCKDDQLSRFSKILEDAPHVTPDTQWIKPKFPATTPEEWREFGKKLTTPSECPRCGSKDFWTVLPACHGGKAHKWHRKENL